MEISGGPDVARGRQLTFTGLNNVYNKIKICLKTAWLQPLAVENNLNVSFPQSRLIHICPSKVVGRGLSWVTNHSIFILSWCSSLIPKLWWRIDQCRETGIPRKKTTTTEQVKNESYLPALTPSVGASSFFFLYSSKRQLGQNGPE